MSVRDTPKVIENRISTQIYIFGIYICYYLPKPIRYEWNRHGHHIWKTKLYLCVIHMEIRWNSKKVLRREHYLVFCLFFSRIIWEYPYHMENKFTVISIRTYSLIWEACSVTVSVKSWSPEWPVGLDAQIFSLKSGFVHISSIVIKETGKTRPKYLLLEIFMWIK